jgi:SAM-dependent methyltransferase
VLNPWGASDDFYLALMLGAGSVLDVGCGTGALVRRAREAGHTGRLCGVDPDQASLALARRRADVEWVAGTAASMPFEGEFELAVMTSHAFQVLVDDDELRASLAAIRRALAGGGRFAFETRNPPARAWERWNPANATDVLDPGGRPLRIAHQVESVAGEVVTLTETTSDPDGTPLRVDRASLRFLGADRLAAFLAEAGFGVEAQYGDWSRAPRARRARRSSPSPARKAEIARGAGRTGRVSRAGRVSRGRLAGRRAGPLSAGAATPPAGGPYGSAPVATGRDGSVIQSLHEPR